MSVRGTMRRRITPRAWACSAAPSRSRTSACAVRIGRGPRRSASARLSPSTQLAVRYANVPTTPAAYTWRIAGWSRAPTVSVSRRNQARPGESGARYTCKATERFSTRSHAWYTARSGVAATRWSRRNAGVSARTTSSSSSAGGTGWVIAPPNLTVSAQPDLHRGPAAGARPGRVVTHIPQRHLHAAVAGIDRRREKPRELRDRVALGRRQRRAHRGMIEVPGDSPPVPRDAVGRSGECLPAERTPDHRERRPAGVGSEPSCRGGPRLRLGHDARPGARGGVDTQHEQPVRRGAAPACYAEPVARPTHHARCRAAEHPQPHPPHDEIVTPPQHERGDPDERDEIHERRPPVPPRTPRERHERHYPEERIDDRNPIGVVPPRAPWQERSQAVGSLPVEVEVADDGRGDARGNPAPRWWAHPPTAGPEAQDQANQTGQGGDLDRSPHERMRDAAMIDQVLAPGTGCPGARLQQKLGPVRGIPGDCADPPGSRPFATGAGPTGSG